MVARMVLPLLALCLSLGLAGLKAADFTIYPQPAGLTRTDGSLALEDAVIVFSGGPREELSALAGQLSQELADRCRLALVCREWRSGDQTGPAVVIGLAADPQIARLLAASPEGPALDWRVPEGYRLSVTPRGAVIAGHDLRGLFYGIQSFLQLAGPTGRRRLRRGGRPAAQELPRCACLPARARPVAVFPQLPGTMAHFKINTLILEVGGGMRLDRHPEINIAWEHFCRSFYDSGDPMRPLRRADTAGLQEAVPGLGAHRAGRGRLADQGRGARASGVRPANSHGCGPGNPVADSHTYYLVLAHRDIAEIPESEWPDSYDPANPKSYEMLFDVIDEYLEVIRPEWVHIGHDEWRAGVKGIPGELFARDVIEITRYLRSRGIEDHDVGRPPGAGHNMEDDRENCRTSEGLVRLIPRPKKPRRADRRRKRPRYPDAQLVLGFCPQLVRSAWPGMAGNRCWAISWGPRNTTSGRRCSPGRISWGRKCPPGALADEFSFGQNGAMLNMLLSNNLLWSGQYPPLEELSAHLASGCPRCEGCSPVNALALAWTCCAAGRATRS